MKIKIIESAKEDLKEGYYFYESQEIGLSNYFLESYADIELLRSYLGIYNIFFGADIIVFSQKDFLLQSITAKKIKSIKVYAVPDCSLDPA